MQEVVGSIPFASTSPDLRVCPPREAPRVRTRDLGSHYSRVGCPGGQIGVTSVEVRAGPPSVAEQGLHRPGGGLHHGADPVAVVAVERSGIVAEEVGDYFDADALVDQ
jgi:hypothetical protein